MNAIEADEKYILCVQCRGRFSEQETTGKNCCPRCGNTGMPADARRVATVTFTEHEWRILCIWASNWAEQCDREKPSGGVTTIEAMVREIKRQAPDIGHLTMRDELQAVANEFGKVELHQGGKVTRFDPEKKQ
jgi:hypothetical protein